MLLHEAVTHGKIKVQCPFPECVWKVSVMSVVKMIVQLEADSFQYFIRSETLVQIQDTHDRSAHFGTPENVSGAMQDTCRINPRHIGMICTDSAKK